MTTIDHRILIPAPQTIVWAYISDLNNNPAWQQECKDISYLTSRREGPGTRWRYTTDKRREYVVEITAWYNGLGYEYIYVDGPGYKENRGRIRLQEIAEGTIVQWTFTYEIGGMFAGMRNHKRQIESTMAASLKSLYRAIKQLSSDTKADPKSLMRDAPDVEARSQYRPRHPSQAPKLQDEDDGQFRPEHPAAIFDEPPVAEGDAQSLASFDFDEPELDIEDTRPRAPITERATAEAAPDESQREPEYFIDESRFAPPREAEDTLPGVLSAAEPEATLSPVMPEADSLETSEPAPVEPEPVESEMGSETPPAADEEQPAAESAGSGLPVVEPILLPTASPEHSGESIWEIFGVPRPSETQEAARAPRPDQTADTTPEPVSQPPVKAGQGLRILVRRKLVRLRRPF